MMARGTATCSATNMLLLLLALTVAALEPDSPVFRLSRGQNEEGAAFFEGAEFGAWCDKMISLVPELSADVLSPAAARSVHDVYFAAADGLEEQGLTAYAQLCEMLENLGATRGCLDAPSPLTGWRRSHHAAAHGQHSVRSE